MKRKRKYMVIERARRVNQNEKKKKLVVINLKKTKVSIIMTGIRTE